jgi:ABC-2 type transport system ATP-binding protein
MSKFNSASDPSEFIIETRDLKKTYLQNKKTPIEAVRGINLRIKSGICFGLLGPNGAGKSTTIEMMEGILKPTSGEILFRGRPINQEYRQIVGIQFQETSLQDFLKVSEVLDLFSSLYTNPMSKRTIVEICHLRDILDRDCRRLSGGQRQRVLLAIALVNNPEILYVDEPTTGLDPQARRDFWSLIKEIKAQGKTIILTTHYMEEAQLLCDEIAIVDQGLKIDQGSPDELIKKHFPQADLSRTQVHIPNLEDVFLKITGRGLQ